MRKFKLGALLLVASLSIAAVGSAAFSGVAFERTVSAGQVLVDTDANVAIQITNISNYANLVKTEADGKVSLNLNEAINTNKSGGFNTDAIFSIGTTNSGVVKIKNNSEVAVTVALANQSSSNAITLNPTNSSSSTIGAGASADYYFTINTNGQDALTNLNAVLQVKTN